LANVSMEVAEQCSPVPSPQINRHEFCEARSSTQSVEMECSSSTLVESFPALDLNRALAWTHGGPPYRPVYLKLLLILKTLIFYVLIALEASLVQCSQKHRTRMVPCLQRAGVTPYD
uniref:Transmembrane protein n=1 Tax=Schistocephalus solidus TaxID=70667 RepID=A0A183SC84_SCHSO